MEITPDFLLTTSWFLLFCRDAKVQSDTLPRFHDPISDSRCGNCHENLGVLFPDNDGCVLPRLECDERVGCTELSAAAVAVAQQLSYYDLFLLHLTSAPDLFVIADTAFHCSVDVKSAPVRWDRNCVVQRLWLNLLYPLKKEYCLRLMYIKINYFSSMQVRLLHYSRNNVLISECLVQAEKKGFGYTTGIKSSFIYHLWVSLEYLYTPTKRPTSVTSFVDFGIESRKYCIHVTL